jgi:hypothetical protein
MKRFSHGIQTLLFAAVFAALLAGSSVRSSAQLSLTLSPVTQPGAPGTEVIFTGTLTYTGVPDLFLNDIDVVFDPPGDSVLTLDKNVFFFNVPGWFVTNDTYTGPLFGVMIDPSVSAAVYTGTIVFLGGGDVSSTDAVARTNFAISMVPEPGGREAGILAVVCGTILLVRRRKRH